MITRARIVRVTAETFTPAALDETGRLVYHSLKKVEKWVEDHDYEAYEPFDGLSSPLRRLTFGSLLLDRLLSRSVARARSTCVHCSGSSLFRPRRDAGTWPPDTCAVPADRRQPNTAGRRSAASIG